MLIGLSTLTAGRSRIKAFTVLDTTVLSSLFAENEGALIAGAKITAWFDQTGQANDGIQDTSGNRPTLVIDESIGRMMLKFDLAQHLAIANTVGEDRHIFIICRRTNPTLIKRFLSRDTSAVTTSPAYAIQSEP